MGAVLGDLLYLMALWTIGRSSDVEAGTPALGVSHVEDVPADGDELAILVGARESA